MPSLTGRRGKTRASYISSYILRKLDPDLWHQVKVKAAQEQTTIKGLIERLLADWLKEK